ncbi:3-oxoacyl-ACP reductase family protein [Massilia niastensis]|uniref:3-oxoacyl-ACP reductase family protein n=1 Tax=Massilia niastensis TaxID=544911 RepID=UPI000361BF78|nr:3-oxoacyl-ACP reductase family protein [Massilia niastensis]
MHTLTGKVALVTGGSRGIGAAIVRRLCADGAAVVFTYVSAEARAREVEQAVQDAGGRALAVRADSADAAAMQRAVGIAVREFGRLDILVNNAGILEGGLVDQVTLEDFDRIMAVNVRGVFAAIHAAAPHMQEGGRIVNIGSVTAERVGGAGHALYGMTKAAIAGLTRGLARDLGPRGITVNTVQPGPTETEIVADENVRAFLRTTIPLGRMGRDDEIADFVAYLAQPGAGFVNGAALTVDGGYLA